VRIRRTDDLHALADQLNELAEALEDQQRQEPTRLAG
jgi:hypothetical protein